MSNTDNDFLDHDPTTSSTLGGYAPPPSSIADNANTVSDIKPNNNAMPDVILDHESHKLRLPGNESSTPVGPESAVDIIVASAARAAAGAAFGSSPSAGPARGAVQNQLSPNGVRRPRAKLVAAKSVLRSNPNRERKIAALELGKEILKAEAAKVSNRAKEKKAKPTVSKKPVVAKKKVTSKTAAPVTSSNSAKVGAKEIWSGVPTEKVEFSWAGWTKKTFQRQSGQTKGGTDSYWYTPKNKYKLRSLTEVRRFVQLCKASGNEENAWLKLKGKK